MENVQERETLSREIRTAVRHTAVYGLGNVAVKALGFLMLPFYTHYLNPADYGVLEILDLSMSLFGMVLNMGLTPAFLRCYVAAESSEEKRTVVSTACLFGIAAGTAVFLLAVGLVRPVSGLIFGAKIPSTYLLLSFIALLLSFMANLPRTYLRALEASGAYAIVETTTVLLLLVFNVVFIAVLRIGLVGILLSSAIVGVLQFVLLTAWVFRKVRVRFRWKWLEYMLSFGAPLMFSNSGLFVLNFSDRFFLKHFQSLEAVGLYAVGYKFGFMMNYLIVQPFFVMWQSRMYAIHALPQHRNIFKQMFVFYAVLLTYAGLTMSVLSPEIVQLMVGKQFAASQNVIPLVVLSYVFYGLSYYSQLGMLLTDKTKWVAFIGAGAAGLNLALNYFLIQSYGMMGAACATALSFAVIAIASYLCSQRALPLSLGVGRVALIMLLAILLFVISRNVAGIALKLMVLTAFPVVLWKARLLSSSETETIVLARDRLLGRISRLLGQVSPRATS